MVTNNHLLNQFLDQKTSENLRVVIFSIGAKTHSSLVNEFFIANWIFNGKFDRKFEAALLHDLQRYRFQRER